MKKCLVRRLQLRKLVINFPFRDSTAEVAFLELKVVIEALQANEQTLQKRYEAAEFERAQSASSALQSR